MTIMTIAHFLSIFLNSLLIVSNNSPHLWHHVAILHGDDAADLTNTFCYSLGGLP